MIYQKFLFLVNKLSILFFKQKFLIAEFVRFYTKFSFFFNLKKNVEVKK